LTATDVSQNVFQAFKYLMDCSEKCILPLKQNDSSDWLLQPRTFIWTWTLLKGLTKKFP
jgi:hypothetical protein